MRRRRGKNIEYQPIRQEIKESKPKNTKKKVVTCLILVGIFFVILFLNSFFNMATVYNSAGTTTAEKFMLSGPDPYYNFRLCEETLKQGRYPFVTPHASDYDPLLNYPNGDKGARPPLFNMMAVGSTLILQNVMSQGDALGWSMLFLPAIYGALLVFPVYGITRTLFNRKVGIISALLLALTPIHIGGSHGSTLSLFDHDSFLLLLFTCVFFFVIKMLKEESVKKSIGYSCLAGIFVGAIYLTWTAAQFIFTLLLLALVVLFIFDVLKSKYTVKLPMFFSIMFIVAFIVSLPWMIIHQDEIIGFPLMCLIASLGITGLYILIKRIKIPWIVSLPSFGIIGGIGFVILYLIHVGVVGGIGAIYQLSTTIFGEGIYGSKLSQTVAEAHTFGISESIMSFGPALYWLGIAGFALYVIKTYKEKWQPVNIFIITVFIVYFWLISTAGRFLNDIVALMSVFSAFCLFLVIDKVNFKQMFKDMKHYSFKDKRKAIHLTQVFGICFIAFLIVLPNAFLTMDAAVPAETKVKYFGNEYQGAFGNSVYKTAYWVDAFSWLASQDTNIKEDKDKPAFISWWDYGFYESAIGKHPTVADNYQVGLYAAGNFKLSKTEQEAVSVLIVRCCDGVKSHNNGKLTSNVINVFYKYLKEYEEVYNNTIHKSIPSYSLVVRNNTTYVIHYPADEMIGYIENPTSCPSYDIIISPEYGNTILRTRAENAMYHDCWKLMKNLTDEQITNFYKDIQNVTGYSIRYYGTEQYDTQIFGVFTFLTDRGTQGFITYEDDYMIMLYQDKNSGYKYEDWQVRNFSQDKLSTMDLTPITEYKVATYDTLWYRTYYGYGEFPENRMPTYNLRHFKLVYYSPIVVISKYYEGAKVTGKVLLEGQAYPSTIVYVMDEYGVPHDFGVADENGTFNLIAPAGTITFKVFIGQKFNDSTYSQVTTITEEQGRRDAPFNNNLLFNLSYANTTINIRTNQNNLTLGIQGQTYQNHYTYTINQNQNFNIENIIPDEYQFTVRNSTSDTLYDQIKFLKPGDNTIDITI